MQPEYYISFDEKMYIEMYTRHMYMYNADGMDTNPCYYGLFKNKKHMRNYFDLSLFRKISYEDLMLLLI